MSCTPTPHVGDVDVELVAELVDTAGDAINVATATVRYLYLTSPAEVTTRKTAVNDTTGADGKIRYNTEAGDLSAPGVWKMQGYVEVGTGKFSGAETSFEVKPSRHAIYTP